MMTNPNPQYLWDNLICDVGERTAKRMEAKLQEQSAFWTSIFKPAPFPKNMGEVRISANEGETTDKLLPPLDPACNILNPLLKIQCAGHVEGTIETRMHTDEKIWLPDGWERDPEQLARSITRVVLQFLKRRKGFDEWWDDITPLRQAEMIASIAAEICPSIPPPPKEARVVSANMRTDDMVKAGLLEEIEVTTAMVPTGMDILGSRTNYHLDGRWEVLATLRRDDIVKWLRKTSLRMADNWTISNADKNRFKDLAALIKWKY